MPSGEREPERKGNPPVNTGPSLNSDKRANNTNGKKAALKKRSAEEAKTIPQIYDEEAAAASAELSTSGQFPFFEKSGVQCINNGNPAAGSIRQISNRYAEKQRRLMMYTGECISGRRTMEQFLEALMYLMPEPI
ncbi:hypothetical protein T01_1340 [Trichinella spiralis]|uniref:Uncharacterized protein n=1 Tax=Trichinella spiralis TaxID=6334 RepID=A0A0V1AZU8_TRISP|nr:hypothetical protein T01_1340 [Trichinella spiralis]